jgi:F-type H+-transporting ATPase subunit a
MIKKRYIIILCVILMVVFGSIIAFTKPVLPFIQVPGEVLPGTEWFPLGNGLTNTFIATLLTWFIMVILALALRARKRSAEEVPTGFYNFFEMVIEGAYNFSERIAGPKVRELFPYFMTFTLIILFANWMELVPGVDSIGIWEYKPHFQAVKVAEAAEREAEAAKNEAEKLGIEWDGEAFETEAEREEFIHEQELFFEELQNGDLQVWPLLINAAANEDPTAPVEYNEEGQPVGTNPEAAQWTIVPFVRAAATDLNFTVAFALVSMFLVQYYGFKHLGFSYLHKFFPFLDKGWRGVVGSQPIKAMDPVVGLLELVSEISKILSFSFRLFGNIFAGQVLLFVMAFILPVANIAFFGLEFFVGLIQALVFALLSLIFMVQATHSHSVGADDHH